MSFSTSFTATDFHIFLIDGLENRMNAMKAEIRPKFEELGTYVAPFLTAMVGEPVTTHIAKHARRTVNAPDETWVAWSTNRRGYKAYPHFQVGLNKDYLFICFALIYECPKKPLFARHMKEKFEQIWPYIPANYYVSEDHTKPHFTLKATLDKNTIQPLLERLIKVKKTEFLCGLHIPKEDKSLLLHNSLLNHITQTFENLYPLYLLAKEGD